MKFSIISAVAVLASLAAASPTLQTRDPKVFKLVAGPDSPADLAGKTLQVATKEGGGTGWFPGMDSALDATFFIQFDKKSGIAFYSKNTVYQIILRPTHGTPLYFVNLANPFADAAPGLILTDNFTINTVGDVEYFGYNDSNDFIACGSNGAYALYKGGAPINGCVGISLVAQYI